MIIEKLHLHPFGPFENKTIDFSASPCGLHIIYGQNEAGKSSSLRAITDLLFGFQHKTRDNWLYDNKNLRISADLLVEDHQSLPLSRYKRRNNDLLNYQTEEPVNQQLLAKFLGNIDRETFLHTFGITHESLRLGVESILAAGGDLGHALFTASSGLNSLTSLIKTLEEKQNALFTPRAQKAAINADISRINELKKQQNRASVSHTEWKELKEQVQRLEQKELEIVKNLDTVSEKLHQKRRYLEGIHHAPQYRELTAQLSELGTLPVLDQNFSEERITTQTALKEADHRLESLQPELTAINIKLEQINYDEQILASQLQIENLATEAAVHLKARNDRKSLLARIKLLEENVTSQLHHIRQDLTIEKAQQLHISTRFNQQIQTLNGEHIELEQHLKTTSQSLLSSKDNAEHLKKELAQLTLPEDNGRLVSALEEAQHHSALDEQLQELQGKQKLLKKQVQQHLSSLTLWTGTAEELVSLALPGQETIRIYREKYNLISNNMDMVNNSIIELKSRLSEKEQGLRTLAGSKNIITRENLETIRKIRDLGWKTVKNCWLQDEEPDKEFLTHFSDSEDLPTAFERSLHETDYAADTLMENAEKIAIIDNHKNDITALQQQLDTLHNRKQGIIKDQSQLNQQWEQLWQQNSINPQTPAEMSEWFQQLQELRITVAELDKCETEYSTLMLLHENLCSRLLNALSDSGKAGARLKVLIDQARQRVNDSHKVAAHHEHIRRNLYNLEQEQQKLTITIQELSEKKRTWKKQWQAKTDQLGFTDTSPLQEVVTFVTSMLDINQQLGKINELKIRQKAIDNDYRTYGEQVAHSISLLPQDQQSLPPEQAALQLHGLLKNSQDKKKDFITLQKQAQETRNQVAATTQKRAALSEKLTILCTLAGVEKVEQLSGIEQKVARKRLLDNELAQLTAKLTEHTAGQTMEDFFTTIRELNPDELTIDIEHLQTMQQEYRSEHRELVEELALTRQQLNSISSESDALAIAAQIETIKAKTEQNIQQYLTLKTASAILVRTVEQYRKNNQNPVLTLASDYFTSMTNGNYVAVKADFDDKGNPIIKAEKSDNSRLSIDQLSDGSRDQLFLSLRLGSLARHVQNNGPMVFIVDDILVHFDDSRAFAALESMAQLSNDSQIIFFTHHAHLLELIKQSSLHNRVHLHQL